MHSKTRAISEGAMMLAIMSILLLFDRQSAGMFELILFFLSIPVIIYCVKYGMKMAITLCVACLLISILVASFTSIFYLFSALAIGLIYGYGILHEWKNQALFIMCIIANVITTFITVILLSNIFGYSISDDVKYITQLMPDVDLNMDIQQYIFIIVVLGYIGTAFLQALVTHLLANKLLLRFKLKAPHLTNLFDIKIPKWISFLIMASFILYYIASKENFDDVYNKCILCLYCIMLIVAIVDGAITCICYNALKNQSKGITFIILIACFIPVTQMVIAAIGVLDIFNGYRFKMKEGVLR